jgi:hypothetical protein
MEQKIQQLMTALGISREEALQVIADDNAIDHGEKLFELDPELAAGAKKARQVGRKAGTPNKRERKEDFDKGLLIEQLVNAIEATPVNAKCDIANPEREFTFTYNGRKFKVVLSAPRT